MFSWYHDDMEEKIVMIPCSDFDEGRQRAISRFGDEPFTIVDNISDISNQSLFGAEGTILMVDNKDDIHDLSNIDIDAYSDDGLIIVTTCQTSLKDMKVLAQKIKRYGGIVLKKKEDIGSIIDSLHIANDIKSMLHAYTMDDYSQNISIIDEISKMSMDEQKSLSSDDILARLPQRPGSIPPWGMGYGRNRIPGLDDFIYKHDIHGSLEKIQRIIDGGSNPIMTVSWLKGQWRESMEICYLVHDGYTDKQIANMLSLPDPSYRRSGEKDPKTGKSGYPTYKKIRDMSNMSPEYMMTSMKIINDTDKALKGGDRRVVLSPRNLMIRMVTLLCA